MATHSNEDVLFQYMCNKVAASEAVVQCIDPSSFQTLNNRSRQIAILPLLDVLPLFAVLRLLRKNIF